MQAALTGLLGSSFKRGADAEAYRRTVLHHQAERERERKARKEDARNDSAEIADIGGMAITAVQAETFRVELETYQTATIEALELNREALDLARTQLARTLERAYVLEDGRRVFETEDGTKVFDESGNELSPDVITPDEIPDHHPGWETYLSDIDAVQKLEAEQTELLEFQADLDETAEQLDRGDMTVREFDDLREQLRENAPDSVRERLGHDPLEQAAVPPSRDLAAPLNLDADLKALPTPRPLIPGN